MNRPLKILHLEDMQSDAEMVARVIKKSSLDCRIMHVTNRIDFTNSLNDFGPDIVISDHSLPTIDSHEALAIVKKMYPELPFILVTATVSEEYAVDIMKEGAVDYILKDRLQRLPNAIIGTMEKYNLMMARKKGDEEMRASERKYKLMFESNPLPMWMISLDTLAIIAVNEATIRHYGYSREELLKMTSKDLRPAEEVDLYLRYAKGTNHNSKAGIWRHKKKDGTIILVDIIAHDVFYEGTHARLVLANDVTEKIAAESALAEQQAIQKKLVTETSIQVQEREREEIGKELHDNINQILATSKLYLDHAIKKEGYQSELLEKSKENIMLALDEIRKLSHSLIAPELEGIRLSDAITSLIDNINRTQEMQVELHANGFNEELIDKNIKLMFYRIVQEQMSNILKHSKATQVSIKLDFSSEDLAVIIRDNGKGFDQTRNYEGIGLRNIKNRVSFYDGITTINSSPGLGCTLEVRVPA